MTSYIVIVDAGSSGTRPFIYAYRSYERDGPRIYNAKVAEVLRNNGTAVEGNNKQGIDKFVKWEDVVKKAVVDEANLKVYLKGVLDKVEEVLKKKGVDELSDVTLCLYATGGVRSLEKSLRDALFEFLEDFVYYGEYDGGYTFSKPKKRVAGDNGVTDGADESMEAIDGAKEALFGWVAANYSQGHALSDYRKYVEIGGASAQIAFLVDEVAENGNADEDVAAINTSKAEEDSAQTKVEKQGASDVALMVNLKMAKLDVEAAEIRAEMWTNPVSAANRVALSIGVHDTRVAKVEEIGDRNVFLASFPLGVNVGYEAYLKALTENKISLNDDEDDVPVPKFNPGLKAGDKKILYDPSRRAGYSKDIQHDWRVCGMEYTDNTRQLVMGVAAQAIDDLHILEDRGYKALERMQILDNLAAILHRDSDDPEVIGGSVFWHATRLGGDDGYNLDLDKFLKALETSREKKHGEYPEGTKKKNEQFFDSNYFAGAWLHQVLEWGFQISPKSVLLTPYNGSNGRLSWTLGAAVLYASPNLEHLCNGIDHRCCS